MDTLTIKPPEGFVLEGAPSVPDGFELEPQEPMVIPDPAQEDERIKQTLDISEGYRISPIETQRFVAGPEPSLFGKQLGRIKAYIREKTGLFEPPIYGGEFREEHRIKTAIGIAGETAAMYAGALTGTATDVLTNKITGDKRLADLVNRITGFKPTPKERQAGESAEYLGTMMLAGKWAAGYTGTIFGEGGHFVAPALKTILDAGLTFSSTEAAIEFSRHLTDGTPVDWKKIHYSGGVGVLFGTGEVAVAAVVTGIAKGIEKYWGEKGIELAAKIRPEGRTLEEQVKLQEAEIKSDVTRAKETFRKTGKMPDDLMEKYVYGKPKKGSSLAPPEPIKVEKPAQPVEKPSVAPPEARTPAAGPVEQTNLAVIDEAFKKGDYETIENIIPKLPQGSQIREDATSLAFHMRDFAGKLEEKFLTPEQQNQLALELQQMANEMLAKRKSIVSEAPPVQPPAAAEQAGKPAWETTGEIINKETPLWHGSKEKVEGTPKVSRGDLTVGKGMMKIAGQDIFEGFYTTPDEEYAQMYAMGGKGKGHITRVWLKPDAKVLDLSDDIISQEVLGATPLARSPLSSLKAPTKPFPFQAEWEAYAVRKTQERRQANNAAQISDEVLRKKLGLDPSKDDWNLNGTEVKMLEDFLKEKGYDAVRFGRETIILNPAVAHVGEKSPWIEAPPAPAQPQGEAQKQAWEMTRDEFTNDAIAKAKTNQKAKQWHKNKVLLPDATVVEQTTDNGVWVLQRANRTKYTDTGPLKSFGIGTKGMKAALEYAGRELHESEIRKALSDGKSVPRAVLEEYKSEPWAQEALKKGEAPVAPPKGEEKVPIIGGPSGGVSFDTAMRTGLENAKKVIPQIKRQQGKTLKQKVGAMVGTKESLLKKGVAPQEAIWRSSGQLRGPNAEYTQVYPALDDIVEPWVIDAALADIAVNTRLGPFDPINLTNPEGTGAFDKFRKGTYLTKGDIALLKKWNNIIGQEAEKRIPWSVKFFADVEQVMGLWKLGAGFDVQIRRQAGWLRGRHPVLYTEAVAKNLMGYISKARAEKMAIEVEDDPRHEEALNAGVVFLAEEGKEGVQLEQYMSNIPEKIPGVGEVYKASRRGFVQSFNWLQQQLWNQKMERWSNAGTKVTPQMMHDVADFDNTLMGMAQAKSNYGAMARRVLAPVMWSPTLTWSRIRSPSMILTNPTMRAEVIGTLLLYIGSGALVMFAASLIARMRGDDEPVEWDPRSSDFGKVKIGDTRFDVYQDGGPYIRALVQLAWKEKKNQAGRLRTRPRMEVIKQFIRNKRAPVLEFLSKVWTGRTYYGGEAWTLPDWEKLQDDPSAVKNMLADMGEKITETKAGEIGFLTTQEILDRLLPFFVTSSVQATWNDGVIVGVGAGIDEFFSGQTLSYEPSTFAQAQLEQDAAAMKTHNKLWDDISAEQQDDLRRKNPSIPELEAQADAELLPPEEINLSEQNKAAERIVDSLSKEVRKELKTNGIRFSAPSRRLGSFWLNDERYEAYQMFVTDEAEKAISDLMKQNIYIQREDTERTAILRDEIDRAKENARQRLRDEIAKGNL